MLPLDLGFVPLILLLVGGFGVAVALAILAGVACARVLLAATRDHHEPPPTALPPA